MPADWIVTSTGLRFNPLQPLQASICLADIAHHLACVNRWTGAARRPISVAEHSVIVSYRAEELAAENADCTEADAKMIGKWGLLHDASEAYIADIARPLKHSDTMAPYRAAEKRIMQSVLMWAKLPLLEPEEVTRADTESMIAEAHLLLPDRADWPLPPSAQLPLMPWGWGWEAAENLFLKRAKEVGL